MRGALNIMKAAILLCLTAEMVSPCYLLFILFLFLNLCPIVFILLRCILENDWLETLDVEYIYGFV